MENIDKKSCAIEFDRTKCIKCTKCVMRCTKNVVGHLKVEWQDKERTIEHNDNPCILCGQCTLVCPVNAMREQSSIEDVKKAINDKNKIVIVQSAPSVRSSINEIFKLEHGKNIEKKLNTAYRKLGFDKVFDVNFGADITTMVEAEELVERITGNGILPMFTSCCPAWVVYVEKYHPELKNNLTTARSPQIHSGIAYKTWWAEKIGLKAENIVVVSVMPCTAKKHEIELNTSTINGIKAVDYVITVRELGKMIKEANINFENLEESEVDTYGEHTGASDIYGTSGGVMESALRTGYKMITGNDLQNIELHEVRAGMSGFKSANIDINGKNISVAVVSGIRNIEILLNELKENPNKYQYIEVMNCVGGCVNGGGQPLLPMKPTDEPILIEKRRNVLYNLDSTNKKRKAHENELVKEYLNWLEKDKELKHKALHCEYLF